MDYDYTYYDDYATCDTEGINGNCGLECRVFKRGNCKIAGEFITETETIKLLWNENREILELYKETEFIVESFTDFYNPTSEELTMFNLEHNLDLK